MIKLPTYIPPVPLTGIPFANSNTSNLIAGTFIDRGHRGEKFTVFTLNQSPFVGVDGSFLPMVLRLMPAMYFAGNPCPQQGPEDSVRGTYYPKYGIGDPNSPGFSPLPNPFYLVDLPHVLLPFDADIWICGGQWNDPGTTPATLPSGASISHLRRWSLPSERPTTRLTYYPPSEIDAWTAGGIPVPPGATGVFSSSSGVQVALYFGSPTALGSVPIINPLTLPDSATPWPLMGGIGYVLPMTAGPISFVIEL